MDGNGWMHPFVQYHYQEQDGRDGTVRFVAQTAKASKDTTQYLTYLNELSTPGGPLPPTLVPEKLRDNGSFTAGFLLPPFLSELLQPPPRRVIEV
jgi:hypothetical protein